MSGIAQTSDSNQKKIETEKFNWYKLEAILQTLLIGTNFKVTPGAHLDRVKVQLTS